MAKLNKVQKKWVLIGAAVLVAAVAYHFFFSQPFLYAGTLEATKVDLSARLPAAIEVMFVDEGDRIKEGQILLKLSCEDFKIAAHLARNNYERNVKLAKSNFISPEALDELRTQMEDADTRVDWCTITSPLHGKVLERYHEPGEWMNPGTKILTVADVRDIYAYIYVPQPQVASLALDMELTGIVSALNNREFKGRIIKINDEAEFTPKNVQTRYERERLIYGVKVSFLDSNADEILKPGMTIEVALPKDLKVNKDK